MEVKTFKIGQSKSIWLSIFLLFSSLFFLYYPILLKLAIDWKNDENYSHGPLLLLFSLYLIWSKREELSKTPLKTSPIGIIFVCIGLALLILGWIAGELFTQRVSFLIVLYGSLIFVFGWPIARKLAFPVWILILSIPIPYVIYNSLTFPLKLFWQKR